MTWNLLSYNKPYAVDNNKTQDLEPVAIDNNRNWAFLFLLCNSGHYIREVTVGIIKYKRNAKKMLPKNNTLSYYPIQEY